MCYSPAEILLHDYRQGTAAIVDRPYKGGYQPRRYNRKKEPNSGESTPEPPKPDVEPKDIPDPDAAATVELLVRQARFVSQIETQFFYFRREKWTEVDEDLQGKRVHDITSIANSKFYSYRYDLVPPIWRWIYADSLLLEAHLLLLRPLTFDQTLPGEEVLDKVVENLDRVLITVGPGDGGHGPWINKMLVSLEKLWEKTSEASEPPSKRQRNHSSSNFSPDEPYGRPQVSAARECPRYTETTMDLDQFEDHMMKAADGTPKPIVFEDAMEEWPALQDRPWKNPDYLLSKTFGGRRLVPVEIGRSYVDDGWGQELIPFGTFIKKYIESPSEKVGYLAQHDLFKQIPDLRNDTLIPDYAWVIVPPHPTNSSLDQPHVDMPMRNAWFGPAKTITPLHTDGYHNLLCQVVGTKYVRLYPPQATPYMKPRSPEHGVDMSNTSELDVGVLEGWDERPEGVSEEDVQQMRANLEGVEYWECILGPGDTLVIPIGWWHYVRSLSVSFSVSFWWN